MGVRAAAVDDRSALQTYVATGAVTSRYLQDDLARALWPPSELRAAVTRAYGVNTVALSQYLSSAAGTALLTRVVPWWSTDLGAGVRLAALRAAVLADSRDGSISVLGVLQRLPVRFALPRTGGPDPQAAAQDPPLCGCTQECGGSALARFAFLMACLQAGSMAPAR